MFDNIGGKIKGLAEFICYLGIIAFCIVGVVVIVTMESFILGVVVAGIGSLGSWIGSFMLYGTGQLIQNTDIIRYRLAQLAKDCDDDDEDEKKELKSTMPEKTVNNYVCQKCGHTDTYMQFCPKCGSANIRKEG